jgi:hypothetical protein
MRQTLCAESVVDGIPCPRRSLFRPDNHRNITGLHSGLPIISGRQRERQVGRVLHGKIRPVTAEW